MHVAGGNGITSYQKHEYSMYKLKSLAKYINSPSKCANGSPKGHVSRLCNHTCCSPPRRPPRPAPPPILASHPRPRSSPAFSPTSSTLSPAPPIVHTLAPPAPVHAPVPPLHA